jgi:hypothetical protein
MQRPSTLRAPGRGRARRRASFGRDRWRALVAGTCISVVVAGGAYLTGWTPPLRQWIPTPQAKAQAGDELATGSVLIVPLNGETCRHMLIDNATWRIRDQTLVDCHTALVSGGGRQVSATRAEVMRAAFGRK